MEVVNSFLNHSQASLPSSPAILTSAVKPSSILQGSGGTLPQEDILASRAFTDWAHSALLSFSQASRVKQTNRQLRFVEPLVSSNSLGDTRERYQGLRVLRVLRVWGSGPQLQQGDGNLGHAKIQNDSKKGSFCRTFINSLLHLNLEYIWNILYLQFEGGSPPLFFQRISQLFKYYF